MPALESERIKLNWATTDINSEDALGPMNWEGLVQYAIRKRCQRDGGNCSTTCQLSAEYNKGGRNLVRRLDFEDGTSWVARIQLHGHNPQSFQRLECEVHTMTVVRQQSGMPVPEVYAYEAGCENLAEVPFILMEFIPGNTAMDSFGGYDVHRGETRQEFKGTFHTAMADIQVQMSGIRFPKIGRITKLTDGTYSVGPLPKIGGPFDTAAEFIHAWAETTKYPYREEIVRERTPPQFVDELLRSIETFPSTLKEFAHKVHFREGPFPLFHTDFYKSNMIIDDQHNVMSVIDWEDAIVAPWEMVEFAKELLIVPAAMDGPLYYEDEETRQRLAERDGYVKMVREAEVARGLDSCLSTVLGDPDVQNLAHAMWLYKDGRIGFYDRVLDQMSGSLSVEPRGSAGPDNEGSIMA